MQTHSRHQRTGCRGGHSRDQRYPQVVSCGYARYVDPHVEEDKGHDDVIHVALVGGQEYNGYSSLMGGWGCVDAY